MRIGIDIGGTKTAAIAVADNGSFGEPLRRATGFGARAVLDSAEASVRALAERAGLDVSAFTSIGVGIPGAVDNANGVVSHAVNLGVSELALGRELGDRVGVPVRVENDVKAAALGAHQLSIDGATASGELLGGSMAYLNLGTGLAAGIVQNGVLLRGATGTAGEIGHLPMDPRGVLCGCGQVGCLETVASGSAITRMWPSDAEYPVLELFELAAAGDAAALAVQRTFFEGVAAGVRALVLTVDVDRVVIGGGLSAIGEPLLRGVRGVLADWSVSSPFLASLALAERVRLIPIGFPAAAFGAALVGVK
ncbi:ROK family protein [Microterricola viridarii]|uniref:Sugar kinase of the NBD/HSP70 family, may contain an N-terminal HTH domain n=1 Tax=Microterricola viridarii TaxID=412690 RepID=A0A1H1QIH2_9MICO|nr:ROK family protein [Microterricola viridarii]SDS23225.1 Sugar kinase of the NBD/HSP70 family, may contain an N-terminal HTH domain [Microterricola viridarii]